MSEEGQTIITGREQLYERVTMRDGFGRLGRRPTMEGSGPLRVNQRGQ
jgi:hypothetical protein